MQSCLEAIKQVVEENQVLIQEIQESIEEYRVLVQNKKQIQNKFEGNPNTKNLSQQIWAIDQHISHLIVLLNNFKIHTKLKLEDSLTSMIISNKVPAYNMFGSEQQSPIICIQLRIGDGGLHYVPSMKDIVFFIKDSLENAEKMLLNSNILVGIMQLLQPYGDVSVKYTSSLCKLLIWNNL